MPSYAHHNSAAAAAAASAVALLLAATAAQAQTTNPNATGACATTTGGADACGPNGSEAWLNSGLDDPDRGWNPPFLDINGLSHISLDEYYGGVGAQCQQYDAAFRASGDKYGIDPAVLAFIAMQESSCNSDEGGPTPGLMQCSPDNCQNGQGQCQYPVEDNVDCGAWYLQQQLAASGGNAVHALGAYNGWFTAGDWGAGQNGGRGLTEDYPCGDAGRANGQPQNLDYLHETLNGWFLGYDVYGDDAGVVEGKYACQGSCDNGGLC